MPEYLILLHPARETFPGDATDEERSIIGRHFEYLKQRHAAGEVILVGRSLDEHPVGLCVFEAKDDEAARSFLSNDPAIVAGVFIGEVRPYGVVLLRGRESLERQRK